MNAPLCDGCSHHDVDRFLLGLVRCDPRDPDGNGAFESECELWLCEQCRQRLSERFSDFDDPHGSAFRDLLDGRALSHEERKGGD